MPRHKKPKIEIHKDHHTELLWPRFIAKGYREGKGAAWVAEQCKRYENPEQAYQWVRKYLS